MESDKANQIFSNAILLYMFGDNDSISDKAKNTSVNWGILCFVSLSLQKLPMMFLAIVAEAHGFVLNDCL